MAKWVNKDTSTIHNWRYKTSGPSDIDTIKLISSFFEISDYKILLIDKVGKEKIDMKLSDLQILSIKRVYDAIIDFLYEFEKSNGFNDYWFDLDIHPQSRESKLYDMAVASVEKVELVLKKEYCFLGKTKIYIELMDFVYNDLGYTKDQILHSVIHLDEKTPHIHCVVVPLVKKFDKRTNTIRYTISKKQYIRDKIHLSELQDKYHARLIDACYDLERGIKGSDRKHIKIKDYKRINNKLEQSLNTRNEKLENALNEFEENMKSTKNTLIDKDYVKIKKETFDSMNKVVNESKKVMELQPKIQQVFDGISDYAIGYNTLERDNKNTRKIKNKSSRS